MVAENGSCPVLSRSIKVIYSMSDDVIKRIGKVQHHDTLAFCWNFEPAPTKAYLHHLGTLGRYMYLQLLEKNVDVNQSITV